MTKLRNIRRRQAHAWIRRHRANTTAATYALPDSVFYRDYYGRRFRRRYLRPR